MIPHVAALLLTILGASQSHGAMVARPAAAAMARAVVALPLAAQLPVLTYLAGGHPGLLVAALKAAPPTLPTGTAPALEGSPLAETFVSHFVEEWVVATPSAEEAYTHAVVVATAVRWVPHLPLATRASFAHAAAAFGRELPEDVRERIKDQALRTAADLEREGR